ncbi:MAG: helix-turn-helix transcriptional regulator [Butyrivibrio sp.]|jgi:AraC-like DNA-binding protein|nr:helix-turn-helix transcriptional regulator [Butyrivibrio sp.]
MLSKEKYVAPKSDYYIHTPSALAKELFIYPTVIGNFRYEAGYELYRNNYTSFLCMYIKQGDCEITTGSIKLAAKAGQIVLIDCYKPHSYRLDNGWEAVWFHYDGKLARGYYDAITNKQGNVISLASDYRFKKYLDKLYFSYKNTAPINETVINNWIINIMTELMVSNQLTASIESASEPVEDVIAFISDNLDKELSIEELAKKANLSPFYFSRIFKKETGFTPHDYIITSKIDHAKYLLLNTSLSSKDICYQLGFGNESSFCATFKKKTGKTPREYRTNF